MKPIDKSQITKIHVAKSQLKLSDQDYRDILSGFTSQSGEPAASCKDLNHEQADVLLDRFVKMGFKHKRSGKPLKYEEYANRDYKFANPKQLRMLEAMWMDAAREKTEKAFHKFACRIAKVDHISFVLKAHVQKIKLGIENL